MDSIIFWNICVFFFSSREDKLFISLLGFENILSVWKIIFQFCRVELERIEKRLNVIYIYIFIKCLRCNVKTIGIECVALFGYNYVYLEEIKILD